MFKTTDIYGRTVSLDSDTYNVHIIPRHPEIASMSTEEFMLTIEDPDKIIAKNRINGKIEDVFVKDKSSFKSKILNIYVLFENDSGKVETMHVSERQVTGTIKWQKDSNT